VDESPVETAALVSAASAGQQQDAESQSWSAFASAGSQNTFCQAWLALQCAQVPRVQAALLLLKEDGSEAYVPAAVWPDPTRDLSYLTRAAERALAERRGMVLGLNKDEGQAPGSVHIGFPIEVDAAVMGAVVLDVAARPEQQLKAILRQLLWGAGWLESLFRRRQVADKSRILERAATGLDLVQAAQEHEDLDRAAMAVVNELSNRVTADRVSLGMERDGKLQLRAISRTAWFDRKSQLIESIENAMEEAIDQESAVVHPAIDEADSKVIVAQRDLAVRAGARAVLCVPLVASGRPVGALSFERTDGPAFDRDTVQLCEVVGELLGPVLLAKLERERWVSGRLVRSLADFRDRLLGPGRPTFKLAAILLGAALLFVTLVHGDFRISARTTIEGAVQRAVVAPFEGYVAEALVRAGETVRQGQLLAVLDDRDLKLDRVKWDSEREQASRKHREALAKRDRAASQILAAQLAQAEAQLALTEEKLARTRLVAPFDAVVVSGDLSQLLGAPLELGKVLFELAPLDSYRVILKIDERDISYVAVGQRGELALTGLTGTTVPFTLKTVTSVSTAQEGRNYFRAEAGLDDTSAKLRPGMEGVGKISAGEERLIWIGTRNFINWLRISLWAWLP
jgi:GAF domain-containing protein